VTRPVGNPRVAAVEMAGEAEQSAAMVVRGCETVRGHRRTVDIIAAQTQLVDRLEGSIDRAHLKFLLLAQTQRETGRRSRSTIQSTSDGECSSSQLMKTKHSPQGLH
jgi:hypothetical protein